MLRRAPLFLLVGLCSALFPRPSVSESFSIRDGKFFLNGAPFRILSGEMHYARIPPEYWTDRLRKARAMGLNTICTYVFWDLHEPQPGRFDFAGGLDVARFIRLAQREGLHVLLRPGPYVCSEWDFGGIPPWLLRNRGVKVRCMDPVYMKAVTRYVMRLGKELRDLQVTHGGPILMLQVENEYGSYGNDHRYMGALESIFRKAGFDVPFYTSDGGSPSLLEAGTLNDALPVVNFGGDPRREFDALEKFRPGIPLVCGEYWCGWFTHWGDKGMARTDLASQEEDLRWMLNHNVSFNLYMFHGGTNFGWMAGANFDGRYSPDVTSYDYDAPLDEAGRVTPKYRAFREILRSFQSGETGMPDTPAAVPSIDVPSIPVEEAAPLFDNLPPPEHLVQPESMEELGQSYGYILYRTQLTGPHDGNLQVTDLRDYARVYLDGKFVGTLDRTKSDSRISLPPSSARHPVLDILVEALGRINFGQYVLDRKGITERVTLNGVTLMNWEAYPLPMDDAYRRGLRWARPDSVGGPSFFKGSFHLDHTGDTYVRLGNWSKGVVWINGHHLGRYRDTGPQKNLYLPAPWLKTGENSIVIFDLELSHPAPLSLRMDGPE